MPPFLKSYVVTNLLAANAGEYRVIVSNTAGLVTSEPAILDVDTLFTILPDSNVARNAKWNVAWGDYDDDGFIDLFSAPEGRNLLFHNERNGTFALLTGKANGITSRGNSDDEDIHPGWADYDNDGHLDLLVTQGSSPAKAQLFRGVGGGAFVFVTNSPVTKTATSTFSVVWGDFNRDGWLDIFMANAGSVVPATTTNLVYLGQSNGRFRMRLRPRSDIGSCV